VPILPSAPPRAVAEDLTAHVTRLNLLLRSELAPQGVSLAQASTLATLSQRGPTRMTELAAAAAVAQPSMSALIKRMERQGWVRRSSALSDQRAVEVVITGPGARLLAELREARSAALGRHLGRLAAADQELLAQAAGSLGRLVESIEEEATGRAR